MRNVGKVMGYNQKGENNNQYKHGMSKTPEYKSWDGAKQRCLNPKCKDYPRYGALGVTMCDSWINSFINFYNDMGPKPTKKHTLERIEVQGNYKPDNCKWATVREQNNNQRKTKKYKVNGKLYSVGQLATKYNINYFTLWSRINDLKWPIKKALNNNDLKGRYS